MIPTQRSARQSTAATQVTATASHYFFAQSPAIRARAIFPIYAKTMVALVRVVCHHALMKIYELSSCDRHYYAAIRMAPPSTRCGQVDQFRQNAPMWKVFCWSEIKNLVNSKLRASLTGLSHRKSGHGHRSAHVGDAKCLMQIVCFFFA